MTRFSRAASTTSLVTARVDFENPFNLRQKPIQQTEVTAGDSDDRSGPRPNQSRLPEV